MTLFAIALPEEARYVPSGARVCITGPGKVRSAVALAKALTDAPTHRVVNIGTAGALRDGLPARPHRVGRVMEHDFDASAIERLTTRRYHNDLVLGEGLALATGDAFLADPCKRVALAEHADLVDMEGFAIAHAAREFGVACEMFKIVTDSADDRAWSWSETVDVAAGEIGRLVSQLVAWGDSPRCEGIS
ncbi:MAG TPA: nucleosidase [Acidimicrobiales bacterium]|nr:nucleosidase [Acidimicrobiales bacterium]